MRNVTAESRREGTTWEKEEGTKNYGMRNVARRENQETEPTE